MWRVILATLVIVAVLALVVWFSFVGGVKFHETQTRKKGLAGLAGVELLNDAAKVFSGLLNPSLTYVAENMDMLSTETSKKVGTWMQAYNKWRSKDR
jgi:hypothetical protein